MQSANSSVMYCMRAQIQQMNNEGSIVNASSIAGIMGFPKNSAYTATKHGKSFVPNY
jgi:short-subunit dehydrogenase